MGYYNYHGTAKKLIKGGHLISYEITTDTPPVLILYFDNHQPMPMTNSERWEEYFTLINNVK